MTTPARIKIAALVPMRHNSERVPGKNYRLMAGKPLFHHIVETLQKVTLITDVVIDTDSPDIKAGLAEHFPDVIVLDRLEHLRDGEIPMNDILLHDTAQIEADYYLQTHSTNPLLTSETILEAIYAFLQASPETDSLFSVTRLQTRLYDQDITPINHNPNELLRTQDLPPVYEENSCIYLFTRKLLEEKGHRIGDNPMMFEIPAEEAVDIDEELDFTIVDLLMQQRQKNT